MGLNGPLSIRNCTLTSCQRGSYLHIKDPYFHKKHAYHGNKFKSILEEENCIISPLCNSNQTLCCILYKIIHNLNYPSPAPPPLPALSYHNNPCPEDYEIYNFGKHFHDHLICLIHTPEITRREQLNSKYICPEPLAAAVAKLVRARTSPQVFGDDHFKWMSRVTVGVAR